jgi:hypothetical protein
MTEHTPGPWADDVTGDLSDRDGAIYSETSNTIVADNVYGRSEAEADANARLIAAAPDLLAACEALCEAVAGQSALLAIEGALVVEYREALAAIAKARGER